MINFAPKLKEVIFIAASIIVIVLVVALLALRGNDDSVTKTKYDEYIKSMTQQSSTIDTMRLSEGLHPPTNKWFSGLVFGDNQPVFAHPLSFKASKSGFELSVPRITSGEDAVFAPHQPDVQLKIGSSRYEVTDYDDLSVRVSFFDQDDQAIVRATIIRGSPYIFVEALIETEIGIDGFVQSSQRNDSEYVLSIPELQSYGLQLNGASTEPINDEANITVSADSFITIIALPDDVDHEIYFQNAHNLVSGGEAIYSVDADSITNTFNLDTDSETLFASLPHHGEIDSEIAPGHFASLYGKQLVYSGTEFSYSLPRPKLQLNLDVPSLSRQQKDELTIELERESTELSLELTDTYFGGKELYRAANLLEIAMQLEATEQHQHIQRELSQALGAWLDPDTQGRDNRYFFYDNTLGGIVGEEASFGAEKFNDHHFHYGYFIYAASILARYDQDFKDNNYDAVEALIANIAAPAQSEKLPRLRNFDPYTGHSWASGFSDFADGNNQESSSEAVNAWYAMYMWAGVTNNSAMTDQSLWLYSHETTAALHYWLQDSRQLEGFDNYDHPLIAIVWGGKRDYSTFFSPRAQAMLGIQLIPMSPGHLYLSGTENISEQLNHAAPQTSQYDGQFGDYMVMYQSLVDPEAALEKLSLTLNNIDDANSKTYLLAWLFAHQ